MRPNSKQEFEEEIQSAAAETVADRDTPEFTTAERRLINLLAEYTAAFLYPDRYPGDPLRGSTYSRHPWGKALMDSAKKCIRCYNPEKGPFLHYFSRSFRREFRRDQAREQLEERRQGIRLPGKIERKILELKKYCVSRGLDPEDPEVLDKLAAVTGQRKETVAELLRIDRDSSPVSDIVRTEDGEEISLFEFVRDTRERTDERILQEDSVRKILDWVGVIFQEIQDRQKELLSMLVTAAVIQAFGGDLSRARKTAGEYPFFSERIFSVAGEREGQIPLKKEIAEMCGRSEQSASRAFRNFTEKILCRADEMGDPISVSARISLDTLN